MKPDAEDGGRPRGWAALRLRSYFLTGLVVAAPIGITTYLTWSFVGWVDSWVKPLIPQSYNPDTYLPFSLPGVGLLFAITVITLLGALTANLVGRAVVGFGEHLLNRTPLVRNLYRGLKQLFETALNQRGQSFKKVGLIEWPRRGIWSLVFIATDARGEIRRRLGDVGQETVSVFIPTTPNPTGGYLMFVPKKDVIVLDMSVEDAAKLIISAGLVMPDEPLAPVEMPRPMIASTKTLPEDDLSPTASAARPRRG